jgi:hypothetical protein
MGKAKGGRREGSGRKPKSIENNVQEAIKQALRSDPDALDQIWQKVVSEAKKGSEKHTQLLFNYYYGKPKENEGQPTEMIITVNRVRR